MAVVVGSKSLKEAPGEAAVLGRAVGQLVTVPAVVSGRNEDVLVEVEQGEDALGKDVGDVVISIGAVVEDGAKGGLPLLSLENTAGVGSVE